MALRAGYIGIKKSLLNTIKGLSGAKIIKTIGNGLKLTAAGQLSADIDTDTMEFKAGKLSAKGGFDLKTKTYTGAGTNNTIIDFGDDTPIIIFGIKGPGSSGYMTYVNSFIWGSDRAWNSWATTSGSNRQGETLLLSYDNNILTMNGSNTGAAANTVGQEYIVYYI